MAAPDSSQLSKGTLELDNGVTVDGQAVGGDRKGLLAWLGGIRKDLNDYADEEPTFETTGTKFLIHLTSMYFGLRGFSEDMIDAAANPYFKEMGVSNEDGGYFTSTIWLPFSMKPMFAMISDLAPILNYKKRWYFVLYSVMGTLAALTLASLPYEDLEGGLKVDPEGKKPTTVSGTPAFYVFFLCILSISACDILNQGKYSQVCAAKGGSIVSFVYVCRQSAGPFGFMIAGVLNDSVGPRTVCFVAMFFYAQFIPCCVLNFAGDEKLKTYCKPDTVLFKRAPKIFALGFGIFLTAVLASTWNIWANLAGLDPELSKWVRIGFIMSCCVLLLMASFLALPFQIARINVYLWLCRAMTLSFSYALQLFFTAQSDICPDGPNFPNVVYQSMGRTCAAIATLFGVWLFENYVVHWYAPTAFWVTTAFTCVGALFDINLVTRSNRSLLAWTGLGEVLWSGYVPFVTDGWEGDAIRMDDLVSFLFGTQALRSVVDTLDNLPSTLLLSKLCPKGLESTVFGVLVAFFNLGASLSGQVGARFLAYFGFDILNSKDCAALRAGPGNETGGGNETFFEADSLRFLSEVDGNFTEVGRNACCNLGSALGGSMTGLTWALVVGSILLPLGTIPLTWIFIPHIRLDEDFVEDVAPTGDEVDEDAGLSSVSLSGVSSAALPLNRRTTSTMGMNLPNKQASLVAATASFTKSTSSRRGSYL